MYAFVCMRSKMIGPSATLVAGTPEHYDADAGRARVPGDPSTVADHVRDVRLCGVLHVPVIHVYHQAATTQRYAGDMLERVPLRCTATLAVRWQCGTPGAPRSRKARTCFFVHYGIFIQCCDNRARVVRTLLRVGTPQASSRYTRKLSSRCLQKSLSAGLHGTGRDC